MSEVLKILTNPLVMVGVGSAATFVATSYWNKKALARAVADKAKAEDEALIKRIYELETRLAVVGQTVQPLTNAFQAFLVNQLTHYHTPRADELLAKLDPFVLTDAEEIELFSLMANRTLDLGNKLSSFERLCAKLLPLVISLVRHNLSTSAEIGKLIVIGAMMKDEAANEMVIETKLVTVPAQHRKLGD